MDKIKCILKIYVKRDEETGTLYIDWEFPEKCKIFPLIGILETIKQDLIDYNNELSFDSEINDN